MSRRTLNDAIVSAGQMVVGIVGLFLIFSQLFSKSPRIAGFLSSFLSQFWINVIGVVCILAVGTGLYFVRQKWRVLYGAIEVAFALAYGWYAINKVAHVGYVEAISIIAAVYLVVRGIDNIMIGRTKPPEPAPMKAKKAKHRH